MLCGAGGVGKSRLAWEAALQLPEAWNHGFLDLGNPAGTARDWINLSRPTLLIIDDAGRYPDRLRTLLSVCSNQAPSIPKRLRLLLIEREAGPQALWWSELMGEYRAESSLFRQFLYDSPFKVIPPRELHRQITVAWMEAGAPDAANHVPPAQDPFWAKVKQVTGGTPLLLGVLSAAIARRRKAPRLSSEEDLLAPVLQREVERWRHAAPERDRFQTTVVLIAAGTILGGLPLPGRDDVLLLTTTDGSVAVIQAKDGPRLPTFADLGRFPAVADSIADGLDSTLRKLGTLPGVRDVEGSLELVRSLCPGWALRPEAIGNFFLTALFKRRYHYDSSLDLPALEPAALQRLLLVAMSIAPSQAAQNLNRLRLGIGAPAPFSRLLELLTVGLLEQSDDRISSAERNAVSFLLFNSLLKIGGQRPANDVFDVVFGALKRLFARFPSDANLAYRYFKALPSLGLRREEKARLEAYREMMSLVPGVLARIEPDAANTMAGALLALASDDGLAISEETLSPLIECAGLLAARFAADAELLEVLSGVYFKLSIVLSRPDLPVESTPPAIVMNAPAIAPSLERAIARIVTESSQALAMGAKINLVRAEVNLSLMFRKTGDFEKAAAAAARVRQMAGLLPDDEMTREMRIKSLYNALPWQLAGSGLAPALESLRESRLLVSGGAGEGDSALLGTLDGVLAAALARGDFAILEEQCLALAQDVRLLRDTPLNRHLLGKVLDDSVGSAPSRMSGRRFRKFLEKLLSEFEEQTGHRLGQLAYVSILDVAIRSGESDVTRRLLEKAFSVGKQAMGDEDIADAVLQCLVLYWVRSGKRRNERFENDAEVVITETGGGTINAEARLLAPDGSTRKQMSFQLMAAKGQSS